jgi:tocopherol O-methyltransferase
MVDIVTRDWSEEVAPFGGAVIQTALTGQGISGLLKAGWTTIKVDERDMFDVGSHV